MLENIIYPEKNKIIEKGIDPDLVLAENKDFANDLKCSICLELLYDPLSCQNCCSNFCSKCIEIWQVTNKKCPMRCELKIQKLNKTATSLLNKIKLSCPNKCQQIVVYENFISHLERDCSLTKVSCKGCGLEGTLESIKDHLDSCDLIIVRCGLCQKSKIKKSIQNHLLNECSERETNCNKCSQKIKFIDIRFHDNNCRNLCNSTCQNYLALSIMNEKFAAMEKKYKMKIDKVVKEKEEVEENLKLEIKNLKMELDKKNNQSDTRLGAPILNPFLMPMPSIRNNNQPSNPFISNNTERIPTNPFLVNSRHIQTRLNNNLFSSFQNSN
jgi:hypothetical protein